MIRPASSSAILKRRITKVYGEFSSDDEPDRTGQKKCAPYALPFSLYSTRPLNSLHKLKAIGRHRAARVGEFKCAIEGSHSNSLCDDRAFTRRINRAAYRFASAEA